MIGATFDTAQLGHRRRNFRLACDEELRKLVCEPCGQEFAVYEPDDPPEHGYVWGWRCPACGMLVYGRQHGDDPLAKADAPLNAGIVVPGGVR